MVSALEPELALALPPPAIGPEEVEQLVSILRSVIETDQNKGWMTAAEIAAQIGEEGSERRVRKVASAAAPAVVSFPGSRGYKLWQFCSVEEIHHCMESFESQGREMFKRALVYRRAYHKRFRGAQPPVEAVTP
jgi:hypothetical protein